MPVWEALHVDSVSCLREFAGSSMLHIIYRLLQLQRGNKELPLLRMKGPLSEIVTANHSNFIGRTLFCGNFSCYHFCSVCSEPQSSWESSVHSWNEKKHTIWNSFKSISTVSKAVFSPLLMIQHNCCKYHRADSLDCEQAGNISSLGALFLF